MLWALDLMDEIGHVIFAVDITTLAVIVVWIFHFVFDHGVDGSEPFGAIFIGTLDFRHCDGSGVKGGSATTCVKSIRRTRILQRYLKNEQDI